MSEISFLGWAITILAFVLTFLAWRNGRWIKESVNRIDRTVDGMNNSTNATRDLIKEEMAASRSLLEKIEQGQQRMAERHENMLKYLGDLIVADGERTRQLMRELRSS